MYRIFYAADRSATGRLCWRDFRRSDVLDALRQLAREEDTNRVLRYFSYEARAVCMGVGRSLLERCGLCRSPSNNPLTTLQQPSKPQNPT